MLLVKVRGYRMMVQGSSIDARFFLFFLMLHMSFLLLVMATNTLSSNGRIKDGETLVSGNKLFQLRFFSPEGTQRRYIGISCHENLTSNQTVWVANRENPLENNTGILTMRADGKLLVSYENGNVVWSTNIVSTQYTNSSVAVLEDNGNLVVREVSSGSVVWESFDHPCNTLLPGMKIGINLTSGGTRMLTAWRNKSDPSPGMYALGIDPQDPSQFFFWRGSVPYRRVIFWNGSSFNAFRNFHGYRVLPLNKWTRNASVVHTHDEVYLTISPSPGKLRSWLTIGPSDNLETSGADLINYFSTAPAFAVNSLKSSCSEDGVCGPNSICNEEEEPYCKCLPGYKPTSTALWYSGQWSDGCTPILELRCGAKDRYLTLKKTKWPQCSVLYSAANATMCQQICNDEGCSCRAYAWAEFYQHDFSCCLWRDGLKDIQEDVDDNGDGSGLVFREVNIRIASQLLSQEGRRCGACGANAVPYPLSISPSCGDPAYNSFHCNSSNGQLHFRGPDGSSYVVSRINKEDRTFVIKPQGIDLCLARSAKRMDIHLNSSLPFHLTNSNTVLLLNCSSMLEKMSHLNCSSSSPCHRYIQEGRAPCFHSKTCCSYSTGSSESNTSHHIGVLDNQCASYASIVNLDSSAFTNEWDAGIQIEWDAPQEPVCDSNKNCSAWPNSSCRTHNTEVEGKRCLCKDNFRWDPLSMNCTPGGTNNKSPISLTRSSGNKKLILIVAATVAAAIILSVAFAYCLWRRISRRKVKQNQLPNMSLLNFGESFRANELLDLANGNDNLDIPFVEFKCIIEATENFSDSNKLGRGGFGAVYKGKLPGGQEIAVKRLSRWSGQGLEEFKNEVLLIARLQHRNLVRILGYCIEEDEKMLIYEYMPNKSLDFFLFDKTRRTMLEWEKRVNIIMGIARGLLYLHQDSRLRIIHRDLKTSNILLDKDMNPKISDFGMARIFGANQTQENTNRVVGTYGYISPEYAANGIYSVKSDVYSFGIIILEIVSGKKNADFLKEDDATSLAAYAWQLWKEERGLEFMDPSLGETYTEIHVLKSVHLGLLCVQDKASDRPTMSSVLAMLDSESTSLPPPNQPAFFTGCFPASSAGGFNQMSSYSDNEVTISTLEAR